MAARGAALIDGVVALAIVLVMGAMAFPVVGATLDRERTVVGARYLAGSVQRARLEALTRNTAVAVRLELAGERTSLQLFADGNGNGVLQRDIDRGVDVAVTGRDWLDDHAREVALRINQLVPDIGGSGSLSPGSDPLRIGNTSLLAFSPLGTATSGTLYVSAPRGPQMAIRVYGATGRVRVLLFDAQTRQWQP
ncbi:MAG: GspH/FimT family pseudopilin [Vicinamibacterales bacterium]